MRTNEGAVELVELEPAKVLLPTETSEDKGKGRAALIGTAFTVVKVCPPLSLSLEEHQQQQSMKKRGRDRGRKEERREAKKGKGGRDQTIYRLLLVCAQLNQGVPGI